MEAAIAHACHAWESADADVLAFLVRLNEAGYAVVPIEPTKEMVLAGDDKLEDCIDSTTGSDADGNMYESTYVQSDAPAQVWRAMILAVRPS